MQGQNRDTPVFYENLMWCYLNITEMYHFKVDLVETYGPA